MARSDARLQSIDELFGPNSLYLPPAFIVDIDGPLAAHPQRGHYEYDKVDTDTLHADVAELVSMLAEFGLFKIIVVTGRMDDPERQVREKTENWLNDNLGLWDLLYMRQNGDYRPDVEIKKELYLYNIKGNFDVQGVFDDRDRVVDMWRNELGLRCYQVAEGDF